MSKRGQTPQIPAAETTGNFCLHTWKNGGASRDRTDDLKLAKLALSQLSYGPHELSRSAARFMRADVGSAHALPRVKRGSARASAIGGPSRS